jgi:hypothetical protein
MSHTPGPWKLIASNIKQWIVTGKDGAYDIAIVRNICEQEDNHANANLIAAAPDLLRRLEDLCEGLEGMHLPGSMPLRLRKAQAAIATARGQA